MKFTWGQVYLCSMEDVFADIDENAHVENNKKDPIQRPGQNIIHNLIHFFIVFFRLLMIIPFV